MKTIILTVVMLCGVKAGIAQDSLQRSLNNACWVVESNVKAPRQQVIKFYNSRLELIHQEPFNSRKLKYHKKRVREALDKTLEVALANERKVKEGTLAALLQKR